jgi:hypothetical protein
METPCDDEEEKAATQPSSAEQSNHFSDIPFKAE